MPSNALADIRPRARSALLLAAAGDALGWPQELRSGRAGHRADIKPQLMFVPWIRRAGGQYASHQEEIGAGEYSDDTQLILAVARSCVRGSDWFKHFTETELAFWPTYERGGGAATKRAAAAWGRARAPWAQASKPEERERYFSAGGNGVAMRILPHCVLCTGDPNFERLRDRILLDGISTHGHPRAIVGALAYAYALWSALRRVEPLQYGSLLSQTAAAAEQWGAAPSAEPLPADFVESAVDSVPGQFTVGWARTVREMIDLLDTGAGALKKSGSLAVDRPTLESLGAIDSKISGAGTVTAAAALYLASRYASRPSQGLLAAAFAPKADTDTLASMTAAVLGAIDPIDWPEEFLVRVQDSGCLERSASALSGEGECERPPAEPWQSSQTPQFFAVLEDGERELMLPDGRFARPLHRWQAYTKSGKTRIDRWAVRADDGQTLYCKRISRVSSHQQPKLPTKREDGPAGERSADTPPAVECSGDATPPETSTERVPQMGFVYRVREIPRSRRFYEGLLGLEVSKDKPDFVSFAGLLALMPDEGHHDGAYAEPAGTNGWLTSPRQALTLYMPRHRFESTFERVTEAGGPISQITELRGRRVFRCADPDGNVIELLQRD